MPFSGKAKCPRKKRINVRVEDGTCERARECHKAMCIYLPESHVPWLLLARLQEEWQ